MRQNMLFKTKNLGGGNREREYPSVFPSLHPTLFLPSCTEVQEGRNKIQNPGYAIGNNRRLQYAANDIDCALK